MNVNRSVILYILLNTAMIGIAVAEPPQTRNLHGIELAVKDTSLYTLEGTVSDENGEAIPGASICIEGIYLGTASNLDGKYKIEGIPSGKYNISSTAIGYKKLIITDVPFPDFGGILNFKLSEIPNKSNPLAEPLPPINKYITSNYWRQNNFDLETTPAKNVDQALRTCPGITR